MRSICRLDENMLASQEGLCSMEYVSKSVKLRQGHKMRMREIQDPSANKLEVLVCKYTGT